MARATPDGQAYCLVEGVTSPAGQALNGIPGRVQGRLAETDSEPAECVAVLLNGVRQGKSLKRSNLRVIAARRW